MLPTDRNPRKREGAISGMVFLVLAAVLVDMTLVPGLIRGWTGSCFVSAMVALIGMRRGNLMGLLFGWLAAFLVASFSMEPLGFYMLRLGLLGFVAGFFIDTAAIRLIWLDSIIIAMLLFFEQGLGGVLGKLVYRYSLHWNFLGVIFTSIVFAPWLPLLSQITGARVLPGAMEGQNRR